MSRSGRKRELRRRKLRRQILMTTVVVGVALTALIAGKNHASHKNKETDVKSTVGVNAPADGIESQIGKVLQSDAYGQQLGALYKKNPGTADIILNREDYPDSIIEYLIGHEEALDWVVGYPEYMKKDSAEIDKTALVAVDLKNYHLQNNIPQFYQWDQAWGYASYGDGLIAIDGCGPTALSMVMVGLSGNTAMTPKRLADFSVQEGYYAGETGTAWTLMTLGAAQLGLQPREVAADENRILSELNEGRPIICSMGPGDFTTQGHFIVLTGVTGDGKVIINDPNSRVNSRKKWDLSKITGQMKALWSYSYN